MVPAVFDKSKTSIDELMNKVLSFSHIILENAKKVVISRDSEDNKIIECALSANADFIISGDNDLLILKKYRQIKIVKTIDILKIIEFQTKDEL